MKRYATLHSGSDRAKTALHGVGGAQKRSVGKLSHQNLTQFVLNGAGAPPAVSYASFLNAAAVGVAPAQGGVAQPLAIKAGVEGSDGPAGHAASLARPFRTALARPARPRAIAALNARVARALKRDAVHGRLGETSARPIAYVTRIAVAGPRRKAKPRRGDADAAVAEFVRRCLNKDPPHASEPRAPSVRRLLSETAREAPTGPRRI